MEVMGTSVLGDGLKSELKTLVKESLCEVLADKEQAKLPALFTADQLAQMWSLPKSRISEAARRGEIPCVKVGHYVRFREEDVAEFIRNNRKSVPSSSRDGKR